MAFEPFSRHYRHLWPFWTIFDLFGAITSPFWTKIGPFGTKMGPFWGDFGLFLGRSGVISGSIWGHFGVVLGSFWGRFDNILGPIWALCCPFWSHFYGCFAKAKIYRKKLPKFTKIMQNCAKTSPFSPMKSLFRWKTSQNRRFNRWKCAVSGCVWKCPE